MKINGIHLSALLAAALLLGACQSDDTSSEIPEETAPQEETASQEETDSTSYTVVDDLENEVTFDEVPETVVSLIPSNTEIVFALEEGEKLVGVTDFDTYPEEALEIERISDSVEFNAERIIQLDPDVVLAYSTGEAPAGLALLEEADIPVFVIQSATSFEDVYGDIEQLAAVLAAEEKGEELIEDIQGQIEEVQQKLASVEKKQIYFEISPSPDIYTIGQSTFQQEILDHAQVENIFSDMTGWPSISEEEVITRNPAVILSSVTYIEDPIAEMKARSSWDSITAVQEDAIHILDADVTSRPGPRIGEAVELVAKAVYPELME